MNPLFHTEFSISDSLKNVRKSVLIYETIIITTKDSDFRNELKNILDKQFNPERPNAVWCSDITYIWTIDGFVYLTSIMDLYSRKIIAWTLSKTLEVSA